jgi:large subunit ribosomal protein L30
MSVKCAAKNFLPRANRTGELMLKVKLIRSTIRSTPKQRQVLAALGLRRMHQEKEIQDNASMRGMIAKVSHMLKVVE